MDTFSRTVWKGKKEHIVFGIDIGATQCAVSYSFLIPGIEQVVKRVLHWPGQEKQKNEAKIPSLIWYDKQGKPQLFGAESRLPETRSKAEDNGWEKAEYFKLHLHPETTESLSHPPPPLPAGQSIGKIYVDLLRYLFKHALKYFLEHELDGANLWKMLGPTCSFVIAHPNGWHTHEQDMLRAAAIRASLVDAASADDRVRFVTEAEASVHFIAWYSRLDQKLEPGTKFIVCDAGGSTVDTTSYIVKSVEPLLLLEETQRRACVQAGAIYINLAAENHFKNLFKKVGFSDDDVKSYVAEAVEHFELHGKREFEGSNHGNILIPIGNHRLNCPEIDIRRGNLKLPKTMVEGFFNESVQKILRSVNSQLEAHPTRMLLLAGGFGESPHLQNRLKNELCVPNMDVTIVQEPTGKAVADGSVMWFGKQDVVAARAEPYSFGTEKIDPFDYFNPLHHGRKTLRKTDGRFVTGVWSPIVKQDQIIQNGEEQERPYLRVFDNPDPDLKITSQIFAWTGEGNAPYFMREPNGQLVQGFQLYCMISADLSSLRGRLKQSMGADGPYWSVFYRIRFSFGDTVTKAFIIWDDRGVDHRAPATVKGYKFHK
jgi:hypothetical protein